MSYALADWESRGHYVICQDQNDGPRRLFCQEAGAGPALVLLHGFPTASYDWHRCWDALTARFRVLAPDFLGFGFSDKPRPYPYSMRGQADGVEDLLRQKKIDRYHLLTHDIGDTVAQELLARQSERGTAEIQSVCLLNGGLFPETHHALPIQKRLLGRWGWVLARLATETRFRRSLAALFAPDTQPTADEYAAYWHLMHRQQGERNLHRLIRYIAERRQYRSRWVAALQQTTVPLRLIDGLADPVSGAQMVERYRTLIPEPDVVELPGIGHYPQLEAPEAVLEAFFQFHDSR
jgi:pimeloyl-ACP methyl ester carboxylesterase